MPSVPGGVTFRPEAEGEAGAVRRLVAAAFGEPVLASLLDSLRAGDAWVDGLSYVAEREGALVGQVLFTRSLLDAPERLAGFVCRRVSEDVRRGAG